MFAHDTEFNLRHIAALVNTLPGDAAIGDTAPDQLMTAADLAQFLAGWRWTGAIAGDREELEQIKALRPQLAALWRLPADELASAVNELLAQARAVPQIVDHDGIGWHLHLTAADAPLPQRVILESAMALADVVRAGETSRLRICDAPDCDDLYVDLSKNRSRRFCDGTCGNRANVAAYRARRREH